VISFNECSFNAEGAAITTEGATISTEGVTMTTEGATITTEGATMTTEGATMTTEGATMTTEGATTTPSNRRGRTIFMKVQAIYSLLNQMNCHKTAVDHSQSATNHAEEDPQVVLFQQWIKVLCMMMIAFL